MHRMQPDGSAVVSAQPRILASEVPVALVFNGISHAVMMATPQNMEELALGFALSEGILDHADDCHGIDVQTVRDSAAALPDGMHGMEVQLEISSRSFARLKDRRRSIAGRTGCGVCGVESFAALDLSFAPLPHYPWAAQIGLPEVLRAMHRLTDKQLLNVQSGGLHAAGWCEVDGTLLDVFEDVGRHNALDKLMGCLARSGRLQDPGFVILSSRGSHELVRKCAKLGIAAMATVSAPTSMGVRMAELTGMRLWGSCRAAQGILHSAGRGIESASAG
ncbi:formate dehydrogenase accessory sulfurtransferase FdhD [Simplicispira psychrophila]|uniref:formate dehydrogenase accessory sulfurtransferase FdhD n=1 Tax=Simplicispira psychrophila TaxID=80882 RepID=UPI001FE16744|nr:formate dehydrogenase accessory sulfurtransferase FdhD [Simplicispira psychrophila]